MPADRALTVARFSVVGLMTAALYYALLASGVEWLALDPTVSSSIAYPFAVIFNYLMHFYWTYATSTAHSVAGKRYLSMIVCGFLLNGAVMWIGASKLEINYFIAQAMAMLLVIALNFVLSTHWVFRR